MAEKAPQLRVEKRTEDTSKTVGSVECLGLGEKWIIANAVGRKSQSQRSGKERLKYRGIHR